MCSDVDGQISMIEVIVDEILSIYRCILLLTQLWQERVTIASHHWDDLSSLTKRQQSTTR